MRLSNFSFLVGSLAALLLVYHNSFNHSFHYDDFHSIVENPHIRDLGNIGAFFYQPELFSSMPERAMFRPLVLASYAFNYRLGEYAVWGYHLVNFSIHFLCVFCVFLLGRALGKAQWTAAWGAGLFALYPLQAEVVNYISSRSESLATLFYLTSLLTYLHWRKRGEKEWFFLALSLGAFVCALLSKSIAATLPAALLLGEWVWGREPGKGHRWREVAPYHLAYWVLVLGFVAVVSRGIQAAVGDPVRSLHLHFLTQIKAVIYYLYLGEMPVYLSVEHAFEVAQTALSAEVLLPLGLGLSILILLFALHESAAALLCLWAALVLIPASLVPLNVLVNEHRLYLPLAFLSLATAALFVHLPARFRKLVCAALLAICGVLAQQRSAVWQDELSLWTDAVAKAPFMYRAHMHLGEALRLEGRRREALQHHQLASELAPDVVEVHFNRGVVLQELGLIDLAIAAYGKSLEIYPDFLPSLSNLGHVYFLEMGDSTRAVPYYRYAVDLGTRNAAVYRNLGSILHKRGNYAGATTIFEQGLTQIPDAVMFYYGLASAQDRMGLGRAALAHYRTFLRLSRGQPAFEQYSRTRVAALERESPEDK